MLTALFHCPTAFETIEQNGAGVLEFLHYANVS
jgi:hypothetical protein